jgi:hypothetical protein
MSQYWDVYCLTCQKKHGFQYANHRSTEMQELCINAPQIRDWAVHTKALNALGCVDVCATYIGAGDGGSGHLDLDFFIEHGDHELAPRNEYGGFMEECGQRFTCGGCGYGHHICHLPAKHEGAHSVVRPATNA